MSLDRSSFTSSFGATQAHQLELRCIHLKVKGKTEVKFKLNDEEKEEEEMETKEEREGRGNEKKKNKERGRKNELWKETKLTDLEESPHRCK